MFRGKRQAGYMYREKTCIVTLPHNGAVKTSSGGPFT